MSCAAMTEGRELAYIGLGANLGDRLATLNQAVERLTKLGLIRSGSSLYETDPIGFVDQPAFVNAAVCLETHLSPVDLVANLLDIERELGRVRTFPNAPRTVDLDLLLMGDAVIRASDVMVPHPRLHERSFVLVPLADIAPNVVHPTLDASVSDLLKRLGPIIGVNRISGSLMRDA